MEPFIVDFAMQRGHEMMLSREPELSRADLDEIDLHMLQAERIPRLLSVDWLEVDGGITFRYLISGKRLVSQKLLSRTISMADYYSLLLGVVEAVDECRHYLLRETCCLLEDQFMYVGENWDDIRLVYVPLRAGIPGRPLKEALLGLAVRWIARVPDVDGDGLQKVLSILEDTGATLSAVRERLLGLLGQPFSTGNLGESSGQGKRVALPGDLESGPEPDGGGPAHADDNGKRIWGLPSGNELPPRFQVAGAQAVRLPLLPEMDDDEWVPSETKRGDAERAKWLAGAVAAIACAFVWRFVYMEAPSVPFFLVSCGLSLLIAWGVLLVWKRLGAAEAAAFASDITGGNKGGAFAEADSADSGPDKAFARWRFPVREEPEIRRRGRDETEPGFLTETAEPVLSFSEWVPEPDMPKDETVFLGREAGQEGISGLISLLREHAGTAASFRLAEGKTVIGRTAGFSQIVDQAEGVSRTHIEIERSASKIGVRDLNSRNGSWLNGKQMVPYKSYELGRGDELRLAGPSGPKYALQG